MAHTDELECETVSALVVDHNDRVLMFNHRIYDFWIQPGGHIDKENGEFVEEPYEAVLRELREETGILPHQVDWVESDGNNAVARRSTEDPSILRHFDFDRHKVDGVRYHNDHVYLFVLNQAIDIDPGVNESREYKQLYRGEIETFTQTREIIIDTAVRGLKIVASLRQLEQTENVA